MNIITVLPIDYAIFSAKLSGSNDKKNEKQTSMCEHFKKPQHTKEKCWKFHGQPPNDIRRPPNDKPNPGRALMSESTNATNHNLR